MLAKTVVMMTGDPERTPDTFAVPLTWRATGAPMLFPMMDADLRLTRVSDGVTQIRLQGSYSVPLGSLGQIFDDALLHRVAEGTVENLVHRIADALAH